MRQLSKRQYLAVKISLFIFFLLPIIGAGVAVRNAADPVEFLTGETGEFALRMLLLTLFITPLQRLLGWNWLIKLRRMIGLYTFFYALSHFLVYLLLDAQLDFSYIIGDIADRRYITVGFTAFMLLIPLAITSNDRLIRRLGAKRWSRLHKAIYVIAPLAVLHFFWQTRGEELAEPIVYAIITAILLVARFPVVATYIKRR